MCWLFPYHRVLQAMTLLLLCRKLALKLHPDKNKANKAEDAFKAVSKAFSTLSDSQKVCGRVVGIGCRQRDTYALGVSCDTA